MYGFVVTRDGWNYLTSLLAGDTLDITRVMVGSGRLPDNENPVMLTDLVRPVAAATSTKPLVDGQQFSFVIEFRSDLNGGLAQGFWLNEYGVFVRRKDGQEILLYRGDLGDYPQYVSAYVDGAVDVRRFPVALAITDGVAVTINYPADAWMTAEDVDNYFQSAVINNYLSNAQELIDIHNEAPESHPHILGLLDQLRGRIERIEGMLVNAVTQNPFFVPFTTLDEINITGVWNKAQARIEF